MYTFCTKVCIGPILGVCRWKWSSQANRVLNWLAIFIVKHISTMSIIGIVGLDCLPNWHHNSDRYYILETFEGSHDKSPVGPRAGIGDVQMIPMLLWLKFGAIFFGYLTSPCRSRPLLRAEPSPQGSLGSREMCNNFRSTTSERDQAQPYPQEQCRSHIFTTHSNQMTCIVTSGSLLSTEPSWARTTYHSKVLPQRVDKISTATTRYMC